MHCNAEDSPDGGSTKGLVTCKSTCCILLGRITLCAYPSAADDKRGSILINITKPHLHQEVVGARPDVGFHCRLCDAKALQRSSAESRKCNFPWQLHHCGALCPMQGKSLQPAPPQNPGIDPIGPAAGTCATIWGGADASQSDNPRPSLVSLKSPWSNLHHQHTFLRAITTRASASSIRQGCPAALCRRIS